MYKPPVMSLTDFAAAREDPRLLVLDTRLPEERLTLPLINPFNTVAYAPRASVGQDLMRLALLLSGRHVVVVDLSEEAAVAVARALQSADVHAMALERGLDGWRDAMQ